MKFAAPGTTGVDALAQDWCKENNWICLPVSLIASSVRKLEVCSGIGTLIVPKWPLKLRSFVKDVFILPKIDGHLCEGPG